MARKNFFRYSSTEKQFMRQRYHCPVYGGDLGHFVGTVEQGVFSLSDKRSDISSVFGVCHYLFLEGVEISNGFSHEFIVWWMSVAGQFIEFASRLYDYLFDAQALSGLDRLVDGEPLKVFT